MKKLLLVWLAVAALCSLPAHAGDGHNHDAGPAAAGGPALPRFTASSELFEMVGVLKGTGLTLYVDRFADNAPAQGAIVDLEIAGSKVALKEYGPGEYEGTLAAALPSGVNAVTATIVSGPDTDILATDLDLHQEPGAIAAASRWKSYAPWVLGGLALGGLAFARMRRSAASRHTRVGGAA